MPVKEEEEMMVEAIGETTPEGRAQRAMQDIEPVLDDAAAVVDEAVNVQSPVGRYSAKRLNALAKVLNKVMKEIGSDVEFDPSYVDVKDEPMPDTLVRGLMGVQGVVEAFSELEPEEVDFSFVIGDITDDRALAVATANLDSLFKNRRFKKFLREEEPTINLTEEAPVVEEVVSVEEEAPAKSDDEVEDEELDILAML